jgi:hypothetical protein
MQPDEGQPVEPACPMPAPKAVAPKPDPYAGLGGSYVLDMETGERTPATEAI